MSTKQPTPQRERLRKQKTRLQAFLDDAGLTSAQLEAETGISRQSMTKIRGGRDVRRHTMTRILKGVRVLTGRSVTIDELFDFEPDNPLDQA
jgi:predicted transcriptional regulator